MPNNWYEIYSLIFLLKEVLFFSLFLFEEFFTRGKFLESNFEFG